VVVIDGMGEAHGATIYRAAGGRLEQIHRISAADSIGIFYSVVTLHLGFDFNSDEYKIMGLAPYGDPERFRALLRRGDLAGRRARPSRRSSSTAPATSARTTRPHAPSWRSG